MTLVATLGYTFEDVYESIEKGDIKQVEDIFVANPFPDEEYPTLFRCACRVGNIRAVRLFLMCGIPITETVVLGAFESHNVEVFQEFLNHGWDVNTRFRSGHTVLCNAVYYEDLLLWFLDHGADPNAKQYQRCNIYTTPTALAAMHETTSRLKALVSYGAILDSVAIFHAMTSVPGGKMTSELKGGPAIMKFLIQHGIELNGTGVYWEHKTASPLHCAIGLGRKDYVKILLQNGAKQDLERFGGKTPAALALDQGNMDIYEMLSNWPSSNS